MIEVYRSSSATRRPAVRERIVCPQEHHCPLKRLHRTPTIPAHGRRLAARRPSSMTSRQLVTVIGLVAALASMVLFLNHIETDKSAVLGTLPSPSSRIALPNSTSRTEIVSRLREILRIREDAYRLRNSDMLLSIYARDCPCLASDGKAIHELIRRKRIWEGVKTSIEVYEATKLNENLWTVVGLFGSETLYVRTEEGRLVRTEPAGRDTFRFTLIKPKDEEEWLLGSVSVLEGP